MANIEAHGIPFYLRENITEGKPSAKENTSSADYPDYCTLSPTSLYRELGESDYGRGSSRELATLPEENLWCEYRYQDRANIGWESSHGAIHAHQTRALQSEPPRSTEARDPVSGKIYSGLIFVPRQNSRCHHK